MSTSSFARHVLGLIVRSIIGVGLVVAVATAQAAAQQAFVTLNGDPKNEAWWVIAEFHPFTTEVRGIPANRIRKSWCKATDFRKDLIPSELLFDGSTDAMAAGDMSFAIEGRFDGAAAKQVALVGAFEECDGPRGRFILILDQPGDGTPKIRFVNAVRTDRQFGALRKGQDNSIVAWACMECDNFSVLKWDRKKRKFDWQPDPVEQ